MNNNKTGSKYAAERHAEQLNRQPWEPAGIVSHSAKRDHYKKTQTGDKGGVTNLDVDDIFHNEGIMKTDKN